MKTKSRAVRQWLTAFILSPGMMFTWAYFLVLLVTNTWLDHAFKSHLQQAFSSVTGEHYQLNVRSLKAGFCLNSLVLKKLELSPIDASENRADKPTTMRIAKLELDYPDLSFLPFKLSDEALFLQKISKKILSYTAQ